MIGLSLERGVKPMANRKVELDFQVQAMRECLCLDAKRVQAVMRKYDLSERSAFRWYEALLEQLPEILRTAQPGPKGQAHESGVPPVAAVGSSPEWGWVVLVERCLQSVRCGSGLVGCAAHVGLACQD